MELNRDQVVKALECCRKNNFSKCTECPAGKVYHFCSQEICAEAISLIKELTEENERLQAQLEQSEITIKDLRSRNSEFTRANMSLSRYADELQLELAECTQIKADTVRKMQERLKEAVKDIPWCEYPPVHNCIDQIAKELLEEGT